MWGMVSRYIEPVAIAQATMLTHSIAQEVRGPPEGAAFIVPDDVNVHRAMIWSEGTRMAANGLCAKKQRRRASHDCHGLWPGRDDAKLRVDAAAFAEAGYPVITFDYRGWGENSDPCGCGSLRHLRQGA
jgi:hypothetical protein